LVRLPAFGRTAIAPRSILAKKIMSTKDILHRAGLGVGAFVGLMLLSPKWAFAPAAWVAPAFLVLLMNRVSLGKAFLLAWLIILGSGLIAMHNVMPFPGLFFLVMVFFTSFAGAIPYFITCVLTQRLSNRWSILVLPVVFVVYEFLVSLGGGGTWGSIAYTQMSNLSFMQVASVTGIWGIVFLVYFASSLIVWAVEKRNESDFSWKPIVAYGSVLILVLIVGNVRITSYFDSPQRVVRVAAISGDNLAIAKTLYESWTGNEVKLDLNTMTQTSPEVMELQKGLVAFVENPDHEKFISAKRQMEIYEDSLLALSQREAKAGARIIAWSEGLTFVLKEDEHRLVEKAKLLCRNEKIYLVLTVAAILPGKVEFGKKFIENKALLITAKGELVNVFLKNKPVPVVEPSVPGNGKVPVIETSLGKLATSICYDADFPQLMRQAAQQNADILVLPSGDWKEIAPYHAQMAIVRAIENGFSLVRPVSHATSIVCDPYGRILGMKKYDDDGAKVLVSFVPVKRVKTIYSIVGDVVVYVCVIGLIGFIVQVVAKRKQPK
jgi:apolipoprotein N-acyltransferase